MFPTLSEKLANLTEDIINLKNEMNTKLDTKVKQDEDILTSVTKIATRAAMLAIATQLEEVYTPGIVKLLDDKLADVRKIMDKKILDVYEVIDIERERMLENLESWLSHMGCRV